MLIGKKLRNFFLNNRNKKGISEVVGYTLLIVIVIGLAVGVFSYLKFFLNEGEEVSCEEDTRLIIEEASCANNELVVTISNRGLFNVNAYFLRLGEEGSSVPVQLNKDNEIISPSLSPGQRFSKSYTLTSSTIDSSSEYYIEIQAAKYSKGKLQLCRGELEKTSIICLERENENCMDGEITGNEECDFLSNGIVFKNSLYGNGIDKCKIFDSNFESGDLRCDPVTCRIYTSNCVVRQNNQGLCGDGIINGNEICDTKGTSQISDDLLGGNSCISLGGFVGGSLGCIPSCLDYNTSQCIRSNCPQNSISDGAGNCIASLGTDFINEDGDITGPGFGYARDINDNKLHIRKDFQDSSKDYRAYIEWNVSSVPKKAKINNLKLNYTSLSETSINSSAKGTIVELINRPSTTSNDLSGNSRIYEDVADGNIYLPVGNAEFIGRSSSFLITLGGNSNATLFERVNLNDPWFAIGISLDASDLVEAFISSEQSQEAFKSPKLIVNFTPYIDQCPEGTNCIIKLDRCFSLDKPNSLYYLESSINYEGSDCLIVSADNITIDGKGHSINGDDEAINNYNRGIKISSGIVNLTIKNISIRDYYYCIANNYSVPRDNREEDHKSSLKNSFILNSLFQGCTFGINLQSSWYGTKYQANKNIFRNNVFKNSLRGLVLIGERENLIENNTFVSIASSAIHLYQDSIGHLIRGNNFSYINMQSGPISFERNSYATCVLNMPELNSDCSLINYICQEGHQNNGDGTCTLTLTAQDIIEDGTVKEYISGYSKDNQVNLIDFFKFSGVPGDVGDDFTLYSYIEWNISKLPDTFQYINSTYLVYSSTSDYNSQNPGEVTRIVLNRPSLTSSPANYRSLFNEIQATPNYGMGDNFPQRGEQRLFFLANYFDHLIHSDILNQSDYDWFALGLRPRYPFDTNSNPQLLVNYNLKSRENALANPAPSLRINYSPSPIFGSEQLTNLQFDQLNDYVKIGEGSDFSEVCLGGCSFSAWANVNSVVAGQTILARDDWSRQKEFFVLNQLNTGRLRFAVYSDGIASCIFTTNVSIQESKFYHITGVYNKTNVLLYLDGAYFGKTACTFSQINLTAWKQSENTYIGNRETNGHPQFGFNGGIDEIRIYNRSLIKEEILQINNSGRRANSLLTSKGLYAWYRIDRGYGSWEPDYSLNGRNGLISGAEWDPN